MDSHTDASDTLCTYGVKPSMPPVSGASSRYGGPTSLTSISDFVDSLNPAQRQAALATGAVLILAGAGTGKTHTLTAAIALRIAWGVASSRILAVTFTNKAARQMQSRLTGILGQYHHLTWMGTFHALAARMLRMEPGLAGLRDGFQILDAEDSTRVLKRTMESLSLSTKRTEGVSPLKIIGDSIARLKDNLVCPADAETAIEHWIAGAEASGRRVDANTLRLVARVYPAYQRELVELNSADYGDLLLWLTHAMYRDEAVRRRFASLFECVFIDEFQDVNLAQKMWISLLERDHRNVWVVGDDDQAIYSFRGADIRYIRHFVQDYSEATTVRLEQNYRSTGLILEAANAIIGADPNRLGKTLYTKAGPGHPIQIIAHDGPEDEALAIASHIGRLQAHGVGRWGDVAILYRASHLSRPIEDALLRHKIPYRIVGDVSFFYRQEIKDALALLRLAHSPDDSASNDACRRMLNMPARGLGPKAEDAIADHARAVGKTLLQACENPPLLKPAQRRAAQMFAAMIRACAALPGEPLSDHLYRVLVKSGYLDHWRGSRSDDAQVRVENLQEFVTLAGSFADADALFEHAALSASRAGEDAEVDCVTLMTIHAGKGLEFPIVYLPGWEDGILPSAKSVAHGEEAEERRLAYVAITRAKRLCIITHSTYRHGKPMAFSPYLADLPRHCFHEGWLARL